MPNRPSLEALMLPLVVLVAAPVATAAASGASPSAAVDQAPRAAFTGSWALASQTGDDPFKGAADKPSGTSEGQGRPGSLGSALDSVPLEALVDARFLSVADDGEVLRVTYSATRTRTFFGDGEERMLDDGDGPARVIAKRKGAAGERITVSTRWASGRSLAETWDVSTAPRRLTVTGKASGREPYRYVRVYEPAPDRPTPTPTPTAAPVAATPTPGPGVAARSPEPPAGMAACSIRPPRGSFHAELEKMAKIRPQDAERRALASVAPLKVSSVVSSEVEVSEGCLVYLFDLRLPDKGGVQEVFVDAGDGKILASTFEAQTKE